MIDIRMPLATLLLGAAVSQAVSAQEGTAAGSAASAAHVFWENDGLRWSLFGKNLLNKAAVNGSQPTDSNLPVLYVPPRQIGISAGYTF